MSTLYKSIGFNLTTTDLTTIYTCPAETETIIKNIQTTNHTSSGNINIELYVNKDGTDYDIAHHILDSKDSLNLIDGVVVLEEGDIVKLQADSANKLSGLMSFVEVRSDTKNPI